MSLHSYESELRLEVHFHTNQTNFYKKGFAQRLILKERQKVTWKWPITTFGTRSQADLSQVVRDVQLQGVMGMRKEGRHLRLTCIYTVKSKQKQKTGRCQLFLFFGS